MTKSSDNYNFEQSLRDLEQLVERMESGKLSLEESLQAFEQGIKLTRECQVKLAKAEQKVNKLIAEQDETLLVPFEPES